MPLNLSKLIKESNSGVLKSKQLLAYEYWLGTNIKQDYKFGNLELLDGWIISKTEINILSLQMAQDYLRLKYV